MKNIIIMFMDWIKRGLGKESPKQIDRHKMTRENAHRIDFLCSTLDGCVRKLLEYQERGESVYYDFGGHRFYSCDITWDGAYQEMYGMTKAEYDEAKKLYPSEGFNLEALQETATDSIPRWIQEGNKFIYPEQKDEWEEYVRNSAKSLFYGKDLNAALVLMKKIAEGASLEEVIDAFKRQHHSESSAQCVRETVLFFAIGGSEFYESTASGKLTDSEKKMIEEQKKKNANLAALHQDDLVKRARFEEDKAEKHSIR